MIQEQFPDLAILRSQWALPRNQGSVLACTAFGPITAIDTIRQRAGFYEHLSPRFVWWVLRGQPKSVEATANALERSGTCLESMCPYDVALLDTMPSNEAFLDAKNRLPKGIKPVRIAGVDAVKRAICQGSAVTFCMVNGDGSEHVSCIDGYGPDGLYVWDSIGASVVMPWSDLASGGRITQAFRWTGLPLVPVPGYIEGDIPTLIDGVLSLPKGWVYAGFGKPSLHFKNIRLRITHKGAMSSGNADLYDTAFWHSPQFTLYIPKLIEDSTILFNVKMVRPEGALISAEAA
jgi:hypothetical protein